MLHVKQELQTNASDSAENSLTCLPSSADYHSTASLSRRSAGPLAGGLSNQRGTMQV